MGDQILSIDETVIENTAYTPDDVMSFLNGPSDRGFTQLQILPIHTIQRKGNLVVLFTRLLWRILVIYDDFSMRAPAVHKSRIP